MGQLYQMLLDPPPADPRVAHAEGTRPEWANGLPSGPAGYPHDWCWLVADDERVYGYVTEEIVNEKDVAACMGDLAEPFGLRHLVSGSMPLLDLIPRLAEEDSWTLFVLTEQGITHVVTGEEYNSVPVRLCLFALLSELGAEMTHALVSHPDLLTQRLGCLPEQRRNDLLRRAERASTLGGPPQCRDDAAPEGPQLG